MRYDDGLVGIYLFDLRLCISDYNMLILECHDSRVVVWTREFG